MVENSVPIKNPSKYIWRGNACDAICAFKFAPSHHNIWLTYIFAIDLGSLSIAGGSRKCGTLLMFCQTVVVMCPLLLQGKQEAGVKEFAVACFRKRPEIRTFQRDVLTTRISKRRDFLPFCSSLPSPRNFIATPPLPRYTNPDNHCLSGLLSCNLSL